MFSRLWNVHIVRCQANDDDVIVWGGMQLGGQGYRLCVLGLFFREYMLRPLNWKAASGALWGRVSPVSERRLCFLSRLADLLLDTVHGLSCRKAHKGQLIFPSLSCDVCFACKMAHWLK